MIFNITVGFLLTISTMLLAPDSYAKDYSRAEQIKYAEQFYDPSKTDERNRPGEDLWNDIERFHWPDSLGDFQLKFRPENSYVVLYKRLPRWPIDMRSPDRFKRSMVAKEFSGKSSIGHMSVGWSCPSTSLPENEIPVERRGARVDGFVAQTGESGQATDMIEDGWGANAIVSTFTDGFVQNGFLIQRYFTGQFLEAVRANEEPEMFFALAIEVPTDDCLAVRSYVKNYVLHPARPFQNFGMIPDPLKFEGAGCGSFAIAALAHATSIGPLMDTYWRTLTVPEKIFGRRTKAYLPNDVIPVTFAKTKNNERAISKYRFGTMDWDSGKPLLQLHLVDPELAIFSFRKLGEIAVRNSKPTAYQTAELSNLKRTFNFAGRGEYPDESKDQGFQEIDASFDAAFASVDSTFEAWWRSKETTSTIELVGLPYGAGLLVHSTH